MRFLKNELTVILVSLSVLMSTGCTDGFTPLSQVQSNEGSATQDSVSTDVVTAPLEGESAVAEPAVAQPVDVSSSAGADSIASPPSMPDSAAGACAPRPTSATVVNVKDARFGAKGNGSTDDTAAIQKALDDIAGTGGTVYIPDGVYMINAIAKTHAGAHGLEIKGAMTLSMSAGAVLQALPNSVDSYKTVMVFFGATDVNIIGGTVRGERAAHRGSGGEWGMGISIEGANGVVIEGVTSSENWGDGFYVANGAKNVTLCGVVADHNRRQGLSVVDVDGMVVKKSIFKNTEGTPPEYGIDLEPNPGQRVVNVVVSGNRLLNNAGGGFQGGVPVANTGRATVANVVIDGNVIENNGANPVDRGVPSALMVTNQDGARVLNNVVRNNIGVGILLRSQATSIVVQGNTVTGTKSSGGGSEAGSGIFAYDSPRSSITGNAASGNAGYGIYVDNSGISVSGNTVFGNGKTQRF